MEFNAKHQSEFALFLQIQAYLRVIPAVPSHLVHPRVRRRGSMHTVHPSPRGFLNPANSHRKHPKRTSLQHFGRFLEFPKAGARGDGALDAGRRGAFPLYRHFPPDALRCHFSLRFSEYLSNEGIFRGSC